MKFTLTLISILFASSLFAQTFCLRLSEVSNDGNTLVVKVEMDGTAAFELGSSNLQWDFDDTKLANPTFVSSPFPGAPFYIITATEPVAGEASLNFDLGAPGFGSTINTTWTEVGQVSFTMLNPTDFGSLNWLYNAGTTQSVIYLDDEATQILATDPGCLEGLADALPVELLSFKAKKEGQVSSLKWQTASEENSLGFEVQKSADGLRWEEIDWISSNGISHTLQTYSTKDYNPYNGDNYYRLKMIDEDQSFEYSNVETVRFDRTIEVVLFPNPAKDQISFTYAEDAELQKVIIYNQVGSVQYATDAVEENTLNLSDLSGGIYFVEMQFAQQVIRKKLILNK